MKTHWITVSEAAQIAHVSPSAIYAAIAGKRLLSRYRRGNLVIREEDARNWEKTHKRRGRPTGYLLDEAGRARIGEGQKRRWAERKQERR